MWFLTLLTAVLLDNGPAKGSHWVTVAVYIDYEDNTVVMHLYDSVEGATNRQTAFHLICNYMVNAHPEGQTFEYIRIQVMPVAQQGRGNDCGVHVISHIQYLAQNQQRNTLPYPIPIST
jgi:Ulp1 family protease